MTNIHGTLLQVHGKGNSMEGKCPFCGSEEQRIETPYIKPVTHEPITTWCCRAQARNREYLKRNDDPTRRFNQHLTMDEVSKG